MDDIEYMKLAMDLARKGAGLTSPNPMVGSVIVKGNKIISKGWHHRCGGEHAEIRALKNAGLKAKGARLFVTLEPCFHHGRTPPCVDKIISSKVKEVIIAMKDPNPLTNGRSIRKLKKNKIKTKTNLCKTDAEQMNEAFVKYIKRKVPFVAAKTAQTLDGKIATTTGDSKWITSKSTRDLARKIRDEFDAIMVGINTVIKDNPRLSGTKKNKRIKKIILDSKLRIPLNARLFKEGSAEDCYVITTHGASKRKQQMLHRKGVHVWVSPGRLAKVNLHWLMKELAKNEITSILIEGGAQTIGEALKAGIIDKFYVYISPKILGDQRALSSVIGSNIRKINQAVQLKNVQIKKIDQDIILTGYVHRNR